MPQNPSHASSYYQGDGGSSRDASSQYGPPHSSYSRSNLDMAGSAAPPSGSGQRYSYSKHVDAMTSLFMAAMFESSAEKNDETFPMDAAITCRAA